MAYSYAGGYSGPLWSSAQTLNGVAHYQFSPGWGIEYSSQVDLVNRREAWKARGHVGPVWSLTCSSDGRVFLSGGEDGSLRLWELDTGREMRTIARGAALAPALTAMLSSSTCFLPNASFSARDM